MSSENRSKAPAWFRDQKKRIIIVVLILACLLSTLQTAGLVKKIAATTVVASCYNYVKKYMYDGFSMMPFASEYYDFFDDFGDLDEFNDGWNDNSLPDFFKA